MNAIRKFGPVMVALLVGSAGSSALAAVGPNLLLNGGFELDAAAGLQLAQLCKALSAHVLAGARRAPTAFGCSSFANVVGGRGTKSFKDSMRHLEESARKIADSHLHGHMRRREVLPTSTQVDFSQSLDVLLGEICVQWQPEADSRPPDVA